MFASCTRFAKSARWNFSWPFPLDSCNSAMRLGTWNTCFWVTTVTVGATILKSWRFCWHSRPSRQSHRMVPTIKLYATPSMQLLAASQTTGPQSGEGCVAARTSRSLVSYISWTDAVNWSKWKCPRQSTAVFYQPIWHHLTIFSSEPLCKENRHVNYHLGLREECVRRLGIDPGMEVYEHLNRTWLDQHSARAPEVCRMWQGRVLTLSVCQFSCFFSNFQHCVHCMPIFQVFWLTNSSCTTLLLEDVPARFEYMSLAALVLGKVLALGPGILPTSLHRLET